MPTETWLPAVGFEALYEVSDAGRVRRVGGRILHGSVNPAGYVRVTLQQRAVFVHSLVLEAFVGSRPSTMLCRHLDGDPANNWVTNLSWGTHAENAADTKRHGTSSKGTKNGRAKLSDVDVRAIRAAWPSTSIATIAREFGVGPTTIHSIVRGRAWAHVED